MQHRASRASRCGRGVSLRSSGPRVDDVRRQALSETQVVARQDTGDTVLPVLSRAALCCRHTAVLRVTCEGEREGAGYVMLTRTEVAKMIGKSVATVRRLEETVLSPKVAENGMRLFYEQDVERLVKTPSLVAKHGRSEWFRSRRPGRPKRCSPCLPRPRLEHSDVLAFVEVLVALECAPTRVLRQLGIDSAELKRFASAVTRAEMLASEARRDDRLDR